jgi:PHD/YefM family antitoxin component YafN of YafNO toxin-antitoxin module
MDDRDTKLGNDLLRALLRHPEAVVVVDEDDHIRLAFKDELEPARG